MRPVKPLATLLLVFAAAFASTSFASEPAFQPRDPGSVYLALGDSLVTGYEERAHNDNHPGYPHVLLKYLRTINPKIAVNIERARNHETSVSMATEHSDASSQLTRAREFILTQRAMGEPVGLVTLSIGMNDVISVVRGSANRAEALAVFKAQLERVCDGLLAALRNGYGVREGDLVLVSLYNPYPGLEFPGKGRAMDELVPQFNAVIHEVARARDGLPVADVAPLFAGREQEYLYVQRPYVDPSDILDPQLYVKLDFHPRPAGHRAIAQSIMSAMGLRYAAHLPMVAR